MAHDRVRVTLAFPPRAADELVDMVRDAAPGVEVTPCSYQEPPGRRTARAAGEASADDAPELTAKQREAFATAEVLLAFELPEHLATIAPNLRWVQAIGAGIDHWRGVRFPVGTIATNAAGVAAVPIAEFALARLLAVWKRLDELADLQQRREWRTTMGRQVAGRTLGVIGLGAIGTAVAARAAAFGMHVVAVKRNTPPGATAPYADEIHPPQRLHDVLARCDAVVVCAPATPDTDDMFDATAFAAMPKGALFCNVARGSLVDEEALLAAVMSGHLGAAILDVTRQEPLPAESPLWDAPNVYLSPHSSASLDRYMESLFELFTDNLARYVSGQPLRNVVDLSTGY